MKILYVLLLCPLLFVTSGCAPPPSIVTQPGKIAFQADQVVVRIDELQNAAIQAERTQALETSTARTIVTFCVSANQVLKALPSGWQASVIQLWKEAKPKIVTTNPSVQFALTAVDGLIGAL